MAKKKPTLEEIRAKVLEQRLGSTLPIERAEGEMISDRTVPIAITSDQPILHWFGYLQLNHAPESIRMDQMKAGAPLLLEHWREKKIGGLLNVRTDGHVLRADAKFSRRPEADAELMDIEDGIARGISGGFSVHHLVLVEEREDDYDLYRSDDWTPIEASLVSIPADISVGVGRDLEAARADNEEQGADCADDPDGPGEDDEAEEVEESDDSQRAANQPATIITLEARIKPMDELLKIGDMFGERALAEEFALAGKTADELKRAILEKRQKAQPELPPSKPVVQLTARELQRYSITRAILADANSRAQKGDRQRVERCFELEISEEIERSLDPGIQRNGGIYVPTLHLREEMQRAGMDTATATKGQEAVFNKYGGFIDLLRNRMMVAQLGATMLAGLQGNIQFVRQNGANAFTWVAQNPGSDVAEGELTLELITGTPKTGQSTTSFSRQLLAQSSFAVDSLVQSDLALVAALGLDKAAIHGSGTSNQPTGIYAASGVNSKAFGGPISFDNVVDMETEIALDNADIGSMAYLTTPGARGKAKKTQEFASTNGAALWRDGEMNGYRAEASNQVSATMNGSAATGGTSHGIIFGVWSQLLILEWGAMELITDPYRLKKQGMIEVTSFMLADILLRYPQAFCKGTGQSLT